MKIMHTCTNWSVVTVASKHINIVICIDTLIIVQYNNFLMETGLNDISGILVG